MIQKEKRPNDTTQKKKEKENEKITRNCRDHIISKMTSGPGTRTRRNFNRDHISSGMTASAKRTQGESCTDDP